MYGLIGRVIRIFHRRLCNISELDEEEIAMVLVCMENSLKEAVSELFDEVSKLDPK